MLPLGVDNLIMLDDATRRKVFAQGQRGADADEAAGAKPKWLVGEMPFEAMMRMLDNAVRSTILPCKKLV